MSSYHSEVFRFDDLFWSELDICSVKAEAETLCKAHHGELTVLNGHVSHSAKGDAYYAAPEDWPGYLVSWEA